jgi:futalosine hydrolase
MKILALLSSMAFENDQILSLLKNVRKTRAAGKIIYRGRCSGHDILLVTSGIGKVNAASSATALIENYPVLAVINFGVGGAYPGTGLNRGDVAIASKEIYGDEGVFTSAGIKGMKEIGIPLVRTGRTKYFNEFPLDPPSIPIPKNENNTNIMIKTGNFITVSAVTGSQKRAKDLGKRFDAVCENMEGAAIAHVCALYKLPMIEVRGISNMVGVRDKRKWNLKIASENCQKMVLEIIKKL